MVFYPCPPLLIFVFIQELYIHISTENQHSWICVYKYSPCYNIAKYYSVSKYNVVYFGFFSLSLMHIKLFNVYVCVAISLTVTALWCFIYIHIWISFSDRSITHLNFHIFEIYYCMYAICIYLLINLSVYLSIVSPFMCVCPIYIYTYIIYVIHTYIPYIYMEETNTHTNT